MHKYLLGFCVLFSLTLSAKEYKSLKELKELTGSAELTPNDWLRKDRQDTTQRWQQVCQLNFSKKEGYVEYKTIAQRRDFYKWVYLTLKKQGHEVKAPALAYVVTGMYAKADKKLNRPFAPDWFVEFANEGTALVMSNLIPQLYKIYTGKEKLVGEEAQKWDENYMRYEQCSILGQLFHSLTAKQLKKMDKISRGKGVYSLFVKKELKYTPNSLINCEDRIKYGLEVVMPYAEKLLE